MVKSHQSENLQLVWGAEAIARELGIKRRRCFYLLENGALPARKVGNRWVTDRKHLHAFFLNLETEQ